MGTTSFWAKQRNLAPSIHYHKGHDLTFPFENLTHLSFRIGLWSYRSRNLANSESRMVLRKYFPRTQDFYRELHNIVVHKLRAVLAEPNAIVSVAALFR